MKRRGLSSVGAAAVVSIGLALGVWAALGVFFPGVESQGLGIGRGPVLIALGVFAVTLFSWSRIHSTRDGDL